MAAECHVWLEEHSNVILQRVKGQMELDDYERLVQLTEECVSKMPAGTPVRILTDATNMVPPGPEVRRRAMEVMRRRKPCRMAFFGGERVGFVVSLFMAILLGRNKIRHFEIEEQARAWLMG